MTNKVKEAKRRYPAGTQFYPADAKENKNDDEYYVITEDSFFVFDDGDVISMAVDTKHGDPIWSRIVYDSQKKKWAEIRKLTNEEIIKTIEKRYPVGTQFYPAHVKEAKRDNQYCIITEDSHFEVNENGYIVSMIGDKVWHENPKYGNTAYDRVIYNDHENKWAEIRKPKIENNMKVSEFLKLVEDYIREMVDLRISSNGHGAIVDNKHFIIEIKGIDLSWNSSEEMQEVLNKALATLKSNKVKFEL